MLQAVFEELVKPSQDKLNQSLGKNKIEVQYKPSHLEANFKYKRVNIETHKVTNGIQFDPLGYSAFRESRQ